MAAPRRPVRQGTFRGSSVRPQWRWTPNMRRPPSHRAFTCLGAHRPTPGGGPLSQSILIRHASYGIELVDALTGGPLFGDSAVTVDSGVEPFVIAGSRWIFE